MLEQMIQKKIEELEKEKLKMNIDEKRLKQIDAQLKQYKEMLKTIKEE